MEWFTWDPDYLWAIALVTSVLLNVFQWVQVHGLSVFKKSVEAGGHAPDGKVLVPVSAVTAALPLPMPPPAYDPANRPTTSPWKTIT